MFAFLLKNYKMKKVKIFKNTNLVDLEKSINDWFEVNSVVDVVSLNHTSYQKKVYGLDLKTESETTHICVILYGV